MPHSAPPQTMDPQAAGTPVRLPVGPWAVLTAGSAIVGGGFVLGLAPPGAHWDAAFGVLAVLFVIVLEAPAFGVIASRIRSIAAAAPLLVMLSSTRLLLSVAVAFAIASLREIDGLTFWIGFMAAAFGSLIGETAASIAALRRAQDEHDAQHSHTTPHGTEL